MCQAGFSALCSRLSLEEMSFESIYLLFCLSPEVGDVSIVCATPSELQRGVDKLGCRTLSEVPVKLVSTRAALTADYGPRFLDFFRWLFEMGKALTSETGSTTRIVPLDTGLLLAEV